MITLIEITDESEQQSRNGIEQVKNGRKERRCAMVAELPDKIVDSLATRSKAELEEIATRCRFLLDGSHNDTAPTAKSGKTKGKDDDDALQTLWQAFLGPLRSGEGSTPLPLPILLRGRYGPGFRKAATAVARLIREDFRVSLPVERLKVAQLIVGLAAGEIEAKGKPVSLRILCNWLQNPAAVVDNAFPNYRASGLLSMLVKRVKVK